MPDQTTTLEAWLPLSGSGLWLYRAHDDAREWLESFSHIMGLPTSAPSHPATPIVIHVITHDAPLPASTLWSRPFPLGPTSLRRSQDGSELLLYVPRRSEVTRDDWYYSQWYSVNVLYPGLLKTNRLPLHSALVSRNGQGLLIMAPGGTGKSTTCRRLPEPWIVHGDDECWLLPMPNGGFRAHVLPTWSDLILRHQDRSWSVSESVPVSAMVFLKQATHDTLSPLNQSQAAIYLQQATTQMLQRAWSVLPPPNLTAVRQRVLDLATEYATRIPAWSLDLTLTGQFWDLLDDAGICGND